MSLQPKPPIIVELVEPESDLGGLADVLISAIGLVGVITLGAILLGIVLGAVMFWLRSRQG